jgi:hypothetical protein
MYGIADLLSLSQKPVFEEVRATATQEVTMHRSLLPILAAMPIVLATFILTSTPTAAAPDLVWWTTHALDKVRPYDPEPENARNFVKIRAARNEFEPFQIVLRAEARDLNDVDIAVSDLRGRGDNVLSKGNVSVYLERYLDVRTPSSIDGGTGEWPDALIPRVDNYVHEKRNAFPFKLVKGRNQPAWIEVYIPRSTAAGSYHGQVEISIGGRSQLSIPLDLELWNFELPSTSSLTTTFGFSGVGTVKGHFGKYTNDQQVYDLTNLYRKAGLWHRISLRGGFTVPPSYDVRNGHVKIKWEEFDRQIGPFLDGKVLSPGEPLYGAKLTSEALSPPPGLKAPELQGQYWQQVVAHFREKGWLDRLFNYLWDEPMPSDYPAMVELGKVIHAAAPEIRNLVTSPLHPGWSSFIGIWSPTINCFEKKLGRADCNITASRESYEPEIQSGKQLWWYEACGTHGCNIVGGEYFRGWPSYMVDHDAVRNRIFEWMTWKYGIQGELYFSTTDAYTKKQDVWKDVYLFGGNGDGTLFYPGRPAVIGGTMDIPIESMRLKLIREGLEDYEYLAMAEKALGKKAVTELVDSLVRKTYDFEHDPEELYAVRESIGAQLSK